MNVMTETSVSAPQVARTIGSAAEDVIEARGEARTVKRIFEHRHVPMVIVDAGRRYIEVNRPARLTFRLTLEEMRELAIDDLTPPHLIDYLEQAWARLLACGCVAGRYQVAGRDGSRLDIVYFGLAHVLPGLHLLAFAPADWPEHELDAAEDNSPDAIGSLTPREIEVLALAAEGYGGPELAQALVLSPATVNTHFKHIYAKLDVRNRAAAVAKAMRLGVID